jgi:hypothetical protein
MVSLDSPWGKLCGWGIDDVKCMLENNVLFLLKFYLN